MLGSSKFGRYCFPSFFSFDPLLHLFYLYLFFKFSFLFLLFLLFYSQFVSFTSFLCWLSLNFKFYKFHFSSFIFTLELIYLFIYLFIYNLPYLFQLHYFKSMTRITPRKYYFTKSLMFFCIARIIYSNSQTWLKLPTTHCLSSIASSPKKN
jgi:hypothetical protein